MVCLYTKKKNLSGHQVKSLTNKKKWTSNIFCNSTLINSFLSCFIFSKGWFKNDKHISIWNFTVVLSFTHTHISSKTFPESKKIKINQLKNIWISHSSLMWLRVAVWRRWILVQNNCFFFVLILCFQVNIQISGYFVFNMSNVIHTIERNCE